MKLWLSMARNGDSPSSSYNTIASQLDLENTCSFIESGGTCGRKKTYVYLNEKIIKAGYEEKGNNISLFFKDIMKQIFLPVGYPQSVSGDYMNYQKWDTVQAFCSTITGTFTTQSILKSVGVGNQDVTALGAAITWIIKDGCGMCGRILFAWWQGSSLDFECKYWRMFADILNDFALAIEFTLPWWQLKSNMYPLCLTSTMKALVGVAGGATRASITQHQAVQCNMGDVSAKDGSQETCVNLMASICGIFLMAYFQKSEIMLTLIFVILMCLHIIANYKAVHSLVFKHLNQPRFLIVFNSYLQYDAVATPTAVNKIESICFRSLKENEKYICGFDIKMGCSLQNVFKTFTKEHLTIIMEAFKGQRYIIVPDMLKGVLYVAFGRKIDSELTLRAYFHSIMLGMALSQYNNITLGIKIKRQLHHITSIQRLSNLIKKMEHPLTTSHLQIFSLENFIIFNDFINGEVLSFFTALSINNWDLSRNFLPVGEWRCCVLDDDDAEANTNPTKKHN